jgi:2-dehydro-3-deoxygalactonokinase
VVGVTGFMRGFAAVDWGSSARRVYLLDSAGRIAHEEEDTAGTLTIAPEHFGSEVQALRARIGDMPMLLGGMVGSNRGWMEAPYVSCPATLPDIRRHLLWVEPGRTAIVPGISLIEEGRADVMRGEEIQVFGAQALRPTGARTLICHPGTHTKWIEVDAGAIARFRTVMTGEMFALLRKHSILADLLTEPATPGAAFQRGVERGFAGETLTAALFSIRAGVLLGTIAREDAPSYASGLLIGCDLRGGLAAATVDDEILVLGRGSLTSLYAAAIEQCGYRTREMDGAAAFVAGMRAIAETIS